MTRHYRRPLVVGRKRPSPGLNDQDGRIPVESLRKFDHYQGAGLTRPVQSNKTFSGGWNELLVEHE